MAFNKESVNFPRQHFCFQRQTTIGWCHSYLGLVFREKWGNRKPTKMMKPLQL